VNWIDRVIAWISPATALRRLRAREALRLAILEAHRTPQAVPLRKPKPDSGWTSYKPNERAGGGNHGPNNW